MSVPARLLPPSATPWGERPHLDGLRTVAVYAVVAYHAGITTFEGGFIGVDLFFVLSGYLVSMVLLTELADHGTVRLGRFYARRARRLIPAAAVLVVGTALGALMVTTTLDRSRFVGDATASSLWYANWHFLGEANDYFDADGPESPFIHFWSLSIEEQFYIAFPLVLLVTWRSAHRLGALAVVAGAALLVSVGLQLALAPSDVNRAYLGTDTRVYQILAGSLLAMAFWRWRVRTSAIARVSPALATATQVAVLLAFATVASAALDTSASHRGLFAALAAVCLIATLEVADTTPVAAALSWRPVRYLGQISYGTYLWHWPVLVLAGTVVDASPLAALAISGLLGTALAALSAELVERPIRFNRALDRIPRAAIAGGVTTAAIVGLVAAPVLLEWDRRPVVLSKGGPGQTADNVPGRAEPVPDLDWETIAETVPELPSCRAPDGSDCVVTSGTGATALLIGDSHARMLIPPLLALATDRDMTLLVDAAPACPWQHHLYGEPDGTRTIACKPRRELTYGERIEAIDPDVIVVAGFPASLETRGDMSTTFEAWDDLSRRELVATATDAAIAELTAGGTPLLVVEPVPLLESNPLSCLSAATVAGDCVIAARPEGVEEEVERARARASADVVTVDLDLMSCPELPWCRPIIDGVVVRRDPHHFTPEFAMTTVPVLAAGLDALLGP